MSPGFSTALKARLLWPTQAADQLLVNPLYTSSMFSESAPTHATPPTAMDTTHAERQSTTDFPQHASDDVALLVAVRYAEESVELLRLIWTVILRRSSSWEDILVGGKISCTVSGNRLK
ncbi:hypothetical protein F444_05932 [Phytophthora nicotianae P1976]|uniref:Uncharacterized protein n=1 Tax=Phytophthora nicotianae P1976 TaxID=1317066 RepID=A0A081AKD4_PHYNI|nr:hypothetical protein F444_05932 [Phytophthora nicotianae P1976]